MSAENPAEEEARAPHRPRRGRLRPRGARRRRPARQHRRAQAGGPKLLRQARRGDRERRRPGTWGKNWPREYDGYKRMSRTTRSTAAAGGAKATPAPEVGADPWLTRIFAGYLFAVDYRDRRGHAYMLVDQETTKRNVRPRASSRATASTATRRSCRSTGGSGRRRPRRRPRRSRSRRAWEGRRDGLLGRPQGARAARGGKVHPVSCVDCHDPKSMELRVTRPGFIAGIQKLAVVRSRRPPPAEHRARAQAATGPGPTIRTSTLPARRSAPSSAASATSSTSAARA